MGLRIVVVGRILVFNYVDGGLSDEIRAGIGRAFAEITECICHRSVLDRCEGKGTINRYG